MEQAKAIRVIRQHPSKELGFDPLNVQVSVSADALVKWERLELRVTAPRSRIAYLLHCAQKGHGREWISDM